VKKSILVTEAKPGMYVESLGKNWLDHDFLSNHFVLDSASLSKLKKSGISEIVIDTDKGLDVEEQFQVIPEAIVEEAQELLPPVFPETTGADLRVAQQAYSVAADTVRNLMNHVRSGKALKPEDAEPAAEQLIRSIDRNPQTLNAVTRIKTRDEYTFQHSVGVAALLAGFCRDFYTSEQVEEITIGGIVHDIGKINVPDAVLNKPSRLNDDEFAVMRTHVDHSREILEGQNCFTRLQTDIALLHHERPDGKGYPFGLMADQISDIGAIAAIVDVYDALSTRRVYKEAWEPTDALGHMLKWAPEQFDQKHLLRFIKYLGVYPVGTWVLLESGRAGFVLRENEDSLRPVVQLKIEVKSRRLINEQIDLSGPTGDAIRESFSPLVFGMDDELSL
jgi:HD-GYP domain-containing protein (c-di-GMP phosphodiesterase class II)